MHSGSVSAVENSQQKTQQFLPSIRNRICNRCVTKYEIAEEDQYCADKVEHCSDCGVCILKIDHHCGVFDRCIGKNNLCGFYLLLIFYFGSLGFVVIGFMFGATG